MTSAETPQAVTLRSPDGGLEAEFVPSLNMLCRSLRHRGEELLYAGHGLRAYAEHGKTMGIPLLHPWANRLAGPGYAAAGKRVSLDTGDGRLPLDPNGLPIHGAVPGLLRWQLESAVTGPIEHGVRARLDWSSPALLELFPYVHELTYEATLTDERLTIATTLRATGSDRVPVSFGFHPYLVLPDAPRRTWDVALAASHRLVLDERLIPTGERVALVERAFTLGEQSWDDGLDGVAQPATFSVADRRRTLGVTFEQGFPFAQVYAPPGQDLICFEPMTAPANALVSGDGLSVVAPGDACTAVFSIAVRDNQP